MLPCLPVIGLRLRGARTVPLVKDGLQFDCWGGTQVRLADGMPSLLPGIASLHGAVDEVCR